MIILVADTSGKRTGVAVFKGKKCLYEKYLEANRAYNRQIMALCDDALKASGLKPKDIDVFGAVLGPGSFTGIRVGMAVMKAMAHAAGRAFAGASGLDIMAQSAGAGGRTWAVMDAGRGEVYAALYKNMKRRGNYMLVEAGRFFKMPGPGDTVSGLKHEGLATAACMKNPGIIAVEKEGVDLKAFACIIKHGAKPSKNAVYTLAPLYIRKPEAETRRIKMKAEERKK